MKILNKKLGKDLIIVTLTIIFLITFSDRIVTPGDEATVGDPGDTLRVFQQSINFDSSGNQTTIWRNGNHLWFNDITNDSVRLFDLINGLNIDPEVIDSICQIYLRSRIRPPVDTTWVDSTRRIAFIAHDDDGYAHANRTPYYFDWAADVPDASYYSNKVSKVDSICELITGMTGIYAATHDNPWFIMCAPGAHYFTSDDAMLTPKHCYLMGDIYHGGTHFVRDYDDEGDFGNAGQQEIFFSWYDSSTTININFWGMSREMDQERSHYLLGCDNNEGDSHAKLINCQFNYNLPNSQSTYRIQPMMLIEAEAANGLTFEHCQWRNITEARAGDGARSYSVTGLKITGIDTSTRININNCKFDWCYRGVWFSYSNDNFTWRRPKIVMNYCEFERCISPIWIQDHTTEPDTIFIYSRGCRFTNTGSPKVAGGYWGHHLHSNNDDATIVWYFSEQELPQMAGGTYVESADTLAFTYQINAWAYNWDMFFPVKVRRVTGSTQWWSFPWLYTHPDSINTTDIKVYSSTAFTGAYTHITDKLIDVDSLKNADYADITDINADSIDSDHLVSSDVVLDSLEINNWIKIGNPGAKVDSSKFVGDSLYFYINGDTVLVGKKI